MKTVITRLKGDYLQSDGKWGESTHNALSFEDHKPAWEFIEAQDYPFKWFVVSLKLTEGEITGKCGWKAN